LLTSKDTYNTGTVCEKTHIMTMKDNIPKIQINYQYSSELDKGLQWGIEE